MSNIRHNITRAISQRIPVLTKETMVSFEGTDFKLVYLGRVIAEKVGNTLRLFTEDTSKGVKTRLNILLELYALPLIFQLDYKWYYEDGKRVEGVREFKVADEYYNVYYHDGQVLELMSATSIDELNEWVSFRYGDTRVYESISEIEDAHNVIINKSSLPTEI